MNDFVSTVLIVEAVGLAVRLLWVAGGRIPVRGCFDTAMEILGAVVLIAWACSLLGVGR